MYTLVSLVAVVVGATLVRSNLNDTIWQAETKHKISVYMIEEWSRAEQSRAESVL